MKKLISLPVLLCFLLEAGFAKSENKIGLGLEFHTFPSLLFSYESLPMGFSIPIHLGGFMIEPEASFFSNSEVIVYNFSDTKYVAASRKLSIGFYKTLRSDDMKTSFYTGIRIGREWLATEYTAEDNEVTEDQDETMYYAPTIGAEYFLSDNISFGGEARYDINVLETEYIDEYYYSSSDDDSYTKTETTGITSVRFLFRFYF